VPLSISLALTSKEWEGNMKYSVLYECRTGDEVFRESIVVECDFKPLATDAHILDLIRQDSSRFVKSGTAGISIIVIEEISK